MGTLIGHVAPGFGFLLIGLWHLFNHIKLHSLNPRSYIAPPWFPSSKFRYTEPVLIISGCLASISMELFIGPERHQPLDPDWTIPSNHLHNFEHASISLTLLIYAAFIIALDRPRHSKTGPGLVQVLAGVAFCQEWLLFHLHSTDHMGVEGQYHWLLQLIVVVTLGATLIGIPWRRSFLVSFVRSVSICFQGVWFIVMGFALWTPGFIAKGCFMNLEDGHTVVRCRDDGSLHRAKSLVNIQFSWVLAFMMVFSMLVYMVVSGKYHEDSQYLPLVKEEEEEEEEDLESQKKLDESESFVHMGKRIMGSLELER